MNNQEVGKKGEDLALRYLLNNNYQIIFRNYSKPRWGEIDFIAIDKEEILSFIEVRCRTNDNYGLPEESVTYNKRKALSNSINYYLSTGGRKYAHHPMKAELISVILGKDKPDIKSFPLDINI